MMILNIKTYFIITFIINYYILFQYKYINIILIIYFFDSFG